MLATILVANRALANQATSAPIDQQEIVNIAHQVAQRFDYYNEISSTAKNLVTAKDEIGGQCGDYALAFANLWNQTHSTKALLVIQQQGLKDFPDGFYEVIGKDTQALPFLKTRTTSMLYRWNNVLGIGHPRLGGYKIKLVEKVHIKTHFGIKNWESNGPHVWVKIGPLSVDPTYADLGGLPTIGTDRY